MSRKRIASKIISLKEGYSLTIDKKEVLMRHNSAGVLWYINYWLVQRTFISYINEVV